MKNKKKQKFLLFLSISFNTIAIALFIIGFIVINSDKPNILSEGQFREHMSDIGCEIINGTEFRKDETIDVYLSTNKETCPYLFTYIKFNDNDNLYGYYSIYTNYVLNNNRNIIEDYKTRINLNFEYYNYTTVGDYYKSAILNQNSILYASSNIQYKDKVIDIIKSLGYYIDELGIKISSGAAVIFLLLIIIFMYGVEKKIRNKGWIALVPFYNVGCLFKDILGSGLYALLLLIPIVNIIFIFKLNYKIGVVFWQSKAKCILLMLFPTLFGPLVAFDDSVYNNAKIK